MKKLEYKWIALSCTTIGALFSVLNGSMLLIALPDIMKALHADITIIMWVVMSYMLSITILVPTIGRIADMIGRKKLYVTGFAIFTISSLLSGMSNSGIQLLLFRIIQSIGGALMMANSTVIVTDAFPKKELGKALGINSMVISIANVVGPILGGFLLKFGWRSIFYINVPFGIIGTLWAALQLREIEALPEHQKFDYSGTLVFTTAMIILLIALSFGGFAGWDNPHIVTLFVVAIALFVLFIYIENAVEQPMLDLNLFKTRILAFAYTSNLLNGIARGAVTFLLIFYLQGIKAMDPLTAGILLTPFALAMMIISPISGWLSDMYGSRELSSIGLLISAVGLIGFMGISATTSITKLILWMSIMGFGSGLFISPNTNAIMSNVPADKRGIAAGVRTMMNNAGTVISIALAMGIISSSISPEALQALFVGTQVGSKGIAVAQFIKGLKATFGISFVISLVAAFISYLRGPQPQWKSEYGKWN
ncbi:drug resistance transporter, EmrB/QacA subfamily [Thermoanaerobacter ethanolicus JW 200]|uniref:MFS transporter n=1 Tax=Thermoanaerobacter ethanolicus TaxID=1757 RepID=UPI000202C78F|nr:drug resistance transporter, EmrB/QacA subfamily [Thermoanaerobacter ethanolicus JW 200]HHY78786.1 MFS transporter [Thermoanaerobacter sp.]